MKRLISSLFLVTALSAGADDVSDLRAKIEQQAAELEKLKAALVKVEQQKTPPPAPATTPFKFNGLLQGWAVTGDAAFQDTFRVRRAELKLSGDLGRNIGWTVMADAAKALSMSGQSINQSGRALQDAFITAGAPKRLQLTAGQFKIPLSREGLESSATLDTIERSLFLSDRARGGAYGDIRDVGLALRRTVNDRYDVMLGVFNGTGESHNDVDRNERKSVIARVAVPVLAIDGLRVGASGAWGGGRGNDRRDRAGVDLLFTRGRWKLKSEVMAGRDGAAERLGWYALAAARVSPRVEVVGRVDEWDPDTSIDRDLATARERDYLLGGNLTLHSALRLQANLIRKTYGSDAVSTRNLLLVNLQTSW